MSRTTAKTVETLDFGEVLAVLCQVAQDAGEANGAPPAAEHDRAAGGLPAVGEGESRP